MNKTVNSLSSRVPTDDSTTYIGEDGLKHCTTCGGYREWVITVLGEKIKVNCICDCMARERERKKQGEVVDKREQNRKYCFPESSMTNWTFDRDDNGHPAVTKRAIKYCDNFADFKQSGDGILFYGSVGTGKTYMAACIANRLYDEGYSVYMTSFANLINSLQSLNDGRQEFIDKVTGVDLLIIDDLGAERQTEYMQEQVFNIIDKRDKRKLPMVVTTNLKGIQLADPKDIGSARIFDRILGSCHPIEVEGTSRRRQRANARWSEMEKELK